MKRLPKRSAGRVNVTANKFVTHLANRKRNIFHAIAPVRIFLTELQYVGKAPTQEKLTIFY